MGTKHIHAEVIKAWADGADVQIKVFGYWRDMEDNPYPKWDGDYYRVKPKNIVVTRNLSYNSKHDLTQTHVSSDPNIEYTFTPEGKLISAKVLT